MTPLLVLVFGIHPATAVGTDLLYASATKSVGTIVHGLGHTVQWRIVRRLASGSLPGTGLGLVILSQLDTSSKGQMPVGVDHARGDVGHHGDDAVLPLAVGGGGGAEARSGVAGAAIGADGRDRFRAGPVGHDDVGGGRSAGRNGAAAAVSARAAAGDRRDRHRACGAADADGRGWPLVAGVGGRVLLAGLLCGSIPGIIIGSWLATRMPETVLRPILAATLVLVGVKLVF